MITYSKCDLCGFVFKRPFQRGDYIMKDIGPCPKRKGDWKGRMIIEGIYYEKIVTPKEKVYQKLVEKWQ